MSRIQARRLITAVDADHPAGVGRMDTLAVEEPLEIRVAGAAYTVTMRTPGHDVELALGLLAAEGVISRLEDVVSARVCAGEGMAENTYNVLDVRLAPGLGVPGRRVRRAVTSSACGVCGTESIDLLRTQVPPPSAASLAEGLGVGRDGQPAGAPPRPLLAASVLLSLPDRLRQAQRVFSSTGGLHGVGLFRPDGELVVAREDVGRHNATDKVVGWMLQHGVHPGRDLVLMVSGRTSFELAQKAAMAGIPVLAGISAPSSLAVDVASELGITLAGFVRGDRMNLYTHPERVGLGQ